MDWGCSPFPLLWLIELYLFDEIINNNSKVEVLIKEIFTDKNSTDIQKLYAYLYQQEYYLSINRFDLAEKANLDLNEFYNKNEGKSIEDEKLVVKSIEVGSAGMLKRIQTAPQGRAYRVRKRSNHVTIVVDGSK